MKKIVTGQILRAGMVVGTGFLVAPDLVITVKHNVITADELLPDEPEEKEVIFRVDEGDEVAGQTVNLLEAIDKGIDCVFIRLNEALSEDEMCDLVDAENGLAGIECRIEGFPKLVQDRKVLLAKVINDQEDKLVVEIRKDDQLRNYEGLSGAPVTVLGNIVGVVVRQESSEKLEALAVRYIHKVLQCSTVPIRTKEIPVRVSEEKFNLNDLREKAGQIISMVGPRYNKELNIKTKTYDNLNFILRKDGVKERFQDISSRIKDCIAKLRKLGSYEKDAAEIFLRESGREIRGIAGQLLTDCDILDSNSCEEDGLKQIFKHLNECEKKLTGVFEVEKERFEKNNGVGTYNNRSWRGFMASYMCTFPTQHLDELRDIITAFPLIARMLDIGLIDQASNRSILITGKGGIGKTHLLCDIVNGFLERDIPAVLLLGEMFEGKDSADTVIMNWFQKEEAIENFFAWLNEYGDQNNVYVPVCIDAINEVDDTSYWNRNLPLIIAKAGVYPNVKIIVSCRSIYLEEYLDEEKLGGMVQLLHNGFDEMEAEALGSFCEYYGVNINYDTICIPEFMNPLFLKMLCEIAREKEDKTVIVEDIQRLMDEFFEMKNKTISAYYLDCFSVKDKVVSLVLRDVTQYMADNDRYSVSWGELRAIVVKVLDGFGIKDKASGFMKLLISENLLRESDEKGAEITFAYQKFYEYLYAQKYAGKETEIIVKAVEEKKITLGTLEMIQIMYFRNTGEEFLSKIDNRIHGEAVESFMSGLYWRNGSEIRDQTITEIEKLLSSQTEADVRRAIFGLLAVSTKIGCAVNARYIHDKLSNTDSYRRDYILSFFLLKQYDQVKILSDLCEKAIALNGPTFAKDSVLLWKIVLCWGTGVNDIKLRDKSSKGLVNLFRLYPSDMLTIIDMFKGIDDDYIHERIWQAVYSSLILLAKITYTVPILEYIKKSVIAAGGWPQNVLLRDYLRNIFEYAYYKGWCTEKEVVLARPPYKSKKHKADEKFALQFKNRFSRLYWNCQESDFAIYTIPSEVVDYGVTKKDVGLMIFEDIVKSGYGPCEEYDGYIDYTYGSLRSRDEQIERIGKKYQKIYLYREMGNIYDNYQYSPRYPDAEPADAEQGNFFRKIDLTVIPQANRFAGTKLIYPFYRYDKWDAMTWFKNNDIERYVPNLIECSYEGEEFCMLQGHLSSEETGKKVFREVWMQMRTYLYRKSKKGALLDWFDEKDFEGRWMPEGFGSIYECCVGEYPWSPAMVRYLSQEEQDFRRESTAPCDLLVTVNEYIPEKDSPFCTLEGGMYMFPSKYLFDGMDLSWNNSFGYDANGRTVIMNGQNDAIYINKRFLIEYLNRNELDVVWTVLGEKQIITDSIGRYFPGRSEFSYTYYLDDEYKVSRNHEVYHILEPREY